MFAHVSHIMKIGRNNFKPPPAVESSVVRLVPKKPRPQISWEEWDGLLRIAFVRKNRTLRAGFLGTSSVLELLEGNWRTWCAQNDVRVEDGPVEEGKGWVGMEVDGLGKETGDMVGEAEEEWGGIMDVDEDEVHLSDFDSDGVPIYVNGELKSRSRRKQQGGMMHLDEDEPELLDADENGVAIPTAKHLTSSNKRKRKGKVAELVREKVRRVLEDETGLADRRARQCDEGDFLKLLWAMNKEGIHFS